MANLSPVVISKFGGMSTRYDVGKVPPGKEILTHNSHYREESIVPAPGLSLALTGPTLNVSINGLGSFRTVPSTSYAAKDVLVFNDSGGNVYAENPFPGSPVNGVFVEGIGQIVKLNNPAFPITANYFMDSAAAYGCLWLAFSDLKTGATLNNRKFFFDATTQRFHYETIAYPAADTPIGGYSSSGAGDIRTGTRYAIVLLETRRGYQTGYTIAAITKIVVTSGSQNLTLIGIPRKVSTAAVPDETIVKRIIAFTQAGASSDGPYFYIPTDDFIDGLTHPTDANGNNITKTVINNNTATTLTVSFPDEYLISSTDVTGFLDKRSPTKVKSIYFARSLRRMIFAGEDESTYLISEPDDPETVFATTGINQPGQGDGGIAITAREFRGELYFLKNNGGHLAVDTSATPAEWRTVRRWEATGPAGPWAVDVTDEFMVWAHRSGPFIYTGDSPMWIGYDISGNLKRDPVWEKINWEVQEKIYVLIDRENQIVKFGVPYGRSTKVNMELICDYSRGWRNVRWSYDDRNTTRAIFTNRSQTVSDSTLAFDGRITTAQVMHASNADDGLVLYEDKSNHTNNGSPILQEVQSAFTPYQNVSGIYRLGAIDGTASGNGNVSVTVFGDSSPRVLPLDWALETDIKDFDRKVGGLQNERFSLKVSNKAESENYFELLRVIFWINLAWKTRSI